MKWRGSQSRVEIYDDRIEFSNPGEPIVRLSPSRTSLTATNRGTADGGFDAPHGVCEEKSSGIDKVVGTVEAFQLPAPDFTTTHNRTITIVYGQRSGFRTPRFAEPGRERDRIHGCIGR